MPPANLKSLEYHSELLPSIPSTSRYALIMSTTKRNRGWDTGLFGAGYRTRGSSKYLKAAHPMWLTLVHLRDLCHRKIPYEAVWSTRRAGLRLRTRVRETGSQPRRPARVLNAALRWLIRDVANDRLRMLIVRQRVGQCLSGSQAECSIRKPTSLHPAVLVAGQRCSWALFYELGHILYQL